MRSFRGESSCPSRAQSEQSFGRVSFDGGPQSLAALETCPVADRAIAAKAAAPIQIAELRAKQIRANPEGYAGRLVLER